MGVLDPLDEHLSTVGGGWIFVLCFGVVYAASATGFVA